MRVPMAVVSNRWIAGTAGTAAEVYYSAGSTASLVRALRSLRARRPELIHLNSFMNPRFSIAPLLLWRIGFWGKSALLLSPRGEFGDGALDRRARKKRAYISLIRLLGISRRVIWHSTAAHETADIAKIWGDSVRIIERENQTLLAPAARVPTIFEGPLRAAFVGRIVAHKGLDIALTALARVQAPVIFDVYGSREDQAYAETCERLAEAMPPNVTVRFRGALQHDDVVAVLAEHDVLLMPTAGENFGHIIVEALSASCSVAVTPDTPWTNQMGGGGLVLDRTPQAWTEGIQALASESRQARHHRRLAAGQAYEEWLKRPRAPHVWDTALAMNEGTRDPA